MEVKYGLAINPQRAVKIQPIIETLINSITILPFGSTEAEQAAQIRSILKIAGSPIGAYDNPSKKQSPYLHLPIPFSLSTKGDMQEITLRDRFFGGWGMQFSNQLQMRSQVIETRIAIAFNLSRNSRRTGRG